MCPRIRQEVYHLHIPIFHLIIGDLVDLLPVEAVLTAVLHFVHAQPPVPHGYQPAKFLASVILCFMSVPPIKKATSDIAEMAPKVTMYNRYEI